MAKRTAVIWGDSFTAYDFGPGHPMAPVRLDLTARLCRELGLFDLPDVEVVEPGVAEDDLLVTVHDPEYVAAVRRASRSPVDADTSYGLGTDDDPAFAGIHEASARIAQGTVDACRGVWTGVVEHAVNFPGGMHHAMPDAAAGFCIYNDAAVGIQWLLDQGAQRVAYVDVDVHHGDGVERVFWNDPRVLTVSIHETGRALFPGTGWPTEVGGPQAQGSVVNVPLPPGLGDAGWLRAFHSSVVPVVRAFSPQVIVSQHGADAHMLDPLAHMGLTVDAQRSAADTMHKLAHELCEGRWVCLGGGGYEVVDVVPRAWAHLTAIAAHAPVPVSAALPERWREYAMSRTARTRTPEVMGDLSAEDGPLWWRSWDNGYDPANEVDRAVMAARQAVFPYFGLDPYFD